MSDGGGVSVEHMKSYFQRAHMLDHAKGIPVIFVVDSCRGVGDDEVCRVFLGLVRKASWMARSENY